MKIGIIRCAQTEDYCPGTTDFRMIKERKGAFEGIEEEIEIIGFINCGGCPAKKAVLRAQELVKRGADTIVFASYIQEKTALQCDLQGGFLLFAGLVFALRPPGLPRGRAAR